MTHCGVYWHPTHLEIKCLEGSIWEHRNFTNSLWPTLSLDFSTCGFYLCGAVKQNVYRSNPSTSEELKENM
jgi:hypothetical protein